ncbi:hypothetical protein DL765_010683 [Monosporascus sp. GIB2]|nr:hypothetical protein DL765_010683 [Monosporascus sp. GIB2]
MTTPSFGPDGLEGEYNSGKTIADVAVEKGVEYIIFSTLPPARKISGGKYTKVTPFDAKAKAEQYIRGLQIKSAFYSPGSFMENFQSQTFLASRQAPGGTWIITRHTSLNSQMPLVDAVGNTGRFVEALSYYEEFDYLRPDAKKLVAWAAENTRGRLSTLEGYFKAHPLKLA